MKCLARAKCPICGSNYFIVVAVVTVISNGHFSLFGGSLCKKKPMVGVRVRVS